MEIFRCLICSCAIRKATDLDDNSVNDNSKRNGDVFVMLSYLLWNFLTTNMDSANIESSKLVATKMMPTLTAFMHPSKPLSVQKLSGPNCVLLLILLNTATCLLMD